MYSSRLSLQSHIHCTLFLFHLQSGYNLLVANDVFLEFINLRLKTFVGYNILRQFTYELQVFFLQGVTALKDGYDDTAHRINLTTRFLPRTHGCPFTLRFALDNLCLTFESRSFAEKFADSLFDFVP